MIQTTTYSPDTCGCTLHYSWDDSLPADQRVHTPVDSVTTHEGEVLQAVKCSVHAATANKTAHHAAVNGENQRKNNVHGDLLAAFQSELGTTDANGTVVFKDNVISWSFDQNRVLNIAVKGLTQNKINTAQNAANTKYGAGKVAISAG